LHALLAVDPVTGQRRVLSDLANAGQGPTGSPQGVGVGATGTVYVSTGNDVLLSVQPGSGIRTLLSDFMNPSQGPIGYKPWAIALDTTDSNLLVADRGPLGTPGAALWKVLTLDGTRTLVTDFNFPPFYTNGPQGVAVGASAAVYVVDPGQGTDCRGFGACGALFLVDRTTGTKTMVSDFGNATQGPLGDTPTDVAADTDGTLLVSDQFAGTCSGGCGAIFRVDPATGQRTMLTDNGSATQGFTGYNALGVQVGVGGTIFESGCSAAAGSLPPVAICSVDRTTGVRTVVSNFGNAAQGPGSGPQKMAVYH
jgi:hypothetical protein